MCWGDVAQRGVAPSGYCSGSPIGTWLGRWSLGPGTLVGLQPYDFSEMEIGSLRAAAESTKHFADHKRPARKNPRARWPVFGRTGFKMTQGSSHSLSHWNRKGVGLRGTSV